MHSFHNPDISSQPPTEAGKSDGYCAQVRRLPRGVYTRAYVVTIRVCVDSLAPARLAFSGMPKGSLPAAGGSPSAFAASSSRSV